jgi:hypothetical protein
MCSALPDARIAVIEVNSHIAIDLVRGKGAGRS